MLYRKIQSCRLCGNHNLTPIVDLGNMALTGVFPRHYEKVEKGPLRLVRCNNSKSGKHCGLLQLQHNYNLETLYGDNYGYRSGLNSSMVRHLASIVTHINKYTRLSTGDLVIDIGSNDSTLLQQYKKPKLQLLGVDPTVKKFQKYYPSHIEAIANFFNAAIIKKHTIKKAKIVTSIAMLYDLEEPVKFAQDIYDTLADDGIWVFEQNYMPMMIKNCAYDTICHEHLEYYALSQIIWMLKQCGMKIIDVKINDTNGGSLFVIAAKNKSLKKEATKKIDAILHGESQMRLNQMSIYRSFAANMQKHKKSMRTFLQRAKRDGKVVYGLGASTRGNVLLQHCGITPADIPFIAEVNEYKFGRYTPGSGIPIISQQEARTHKPDYFFVLPWHFRKSICTRERAYLNGGGHLVFPLPKLNVLQSTG